MIRQLQNPILSITSRWVHLRVPMWGNRSLGKIWRLPGKNVSRSWVSNWLLFHVLISQWTTWTLFWSFSVIAPVSLIEWLSLLSFSINSTISVVKIYIPSFLSELRLTCRLESASRWTSKILTSRPLAKRYLNSIQNWTISRNREGLSKLLRSSMVALWVFNKISIWASASSFTLAIKSNRTSTNKHAENMKYFWRKQTIRTLYR